MTKLTLDHHASFRLSTDTKDISARSRTVNLFAISWALFTRGGLHRHSRLIRQVEAGTITLVDLLHVRMENMEGRIGFAEELLSSSHPIFMSLLFFFKVVRAIRLAVQCVQ